MRPMRYTLTAIVGALLALVLWANQWKYFQWENHILRVNRVTGSVYEMRQGRWTDGSLYDEWKQTKNPAP